MNLVYGRARSRRSCRSSIMCEDEVTLPVDGVAAEVPAQASPIKPAWQRWNDYGIGCFLEGGAEREEGRAEAGRGRPSSKLLDARRKDATGQRLPEPGPRLHRGGPARRGRRRTERRRGKADAAAPPWTVAWFTGLVNERRTATSTRRSPTSRRSSTRRTSRATRSSTSRKDYVVLQRAGPDARSSGRSSRTTGRPSAATSCRRPSRRAEQTLALDAGGPRRPLRAGAVLRASWRSRLAAADAGRGAERGRPASWREIADAQAGARAAGRPRAELAAPSRRSRRAAGRSTRRSCR